MPLKIRIEASLNSMHKCKDTQKKAKRDVLRKDILQPAANYRWFRKTM